MTPAPGHRRHGPLGFAPASTSARQRTWFARTGFRGDRSRRGSSAAGRRGQEALAEIVGDASAAHAPAGSDLRKVGDFYTSLVDTAAIERAGLAPIRPLLARIAAIGNRAAFARFVGATLRADVDVINDGALHTDNLFGLWVDQDFNQPTRNSAALLQGGLGLPDRRYYLDSSAAMSGSGPGTELTWRRC